MHVTLSTRHRVLIGTALLAFTATAPCSAQGYPFSQRGDVHQSVAFTTIGVEYGRPTARGRALFGALVPWDSVWHPGADSATRITLSHDVLLEGHPIAAGEYSAWLIPRARGPWTFILSRAAHTFHKPYPGSANDLIRLETPPVHLSHVETLAIYFPMVLRDEAVLRIHWGETGVDLHLKAPYRPE
jgi:Protein of unknown function (DUF2911)